jgi:hypothetical protein
MIHAGEDCEGLEQVQLDDYDDYLLDPLDEDVDVTMDKESSSNIKVDDLTSRRNIAGSSMRSAPNVGTVPSR